MVKVEDIQKLAKKYNTRHFGNCIDLHNIEFRISNRFTRLLGQYSYKLYSMNGRTITLSQHVLKDDSWRKTLMHELIHAYQHIQGYPLDHGTMFKVKAREIYKETGMQIQTCTITSAAVASSIAAKKKSVAKPTTSYAIIHNYGVNFIKYVPKKELNQLKRSYEILEVPTKELERVSAKFTTIETFYKFKRYYSKEALKILKLK